MSEKRHDFTERPGLLYKHLSGWKLYEAALYLKKWRNQSLMKWFSYIGGRKLITFLKKLAAARDEAFNVIYYCLRQYASRMKISKRCKKYRLRYATHWHSTYFILSRKVKARAEIRAPGIPCEMKYAQSWKECHRNSKLKACLVLARERPMHESQPVKAGSEKST